MSYINFQIVPSNDMKGKKHMEKEITKEFDLLVTKKYFTLYSQAIVKVMLLL